MKIKFLPFLLGFMSPIAAFASREGVPIYYQNAQQNNGNAQMNQYGASSSYIGQSGQRYVIGSRSYTYQQPSNNYNPNYGAMTANGVAMPADTEPNFVVSGGYTRRFANFEFKTGVNSILEWNDMVLNEIGVNAKYNFQIRNFDAFAIGDYSMGRYSHGGKSMDYDLEPYDWSNPSDGIFTISAGDQSGTSNHMRFGFGARNVWDVAGWKLSPVVGYEIFHHNLEMSNHLYPNPGVYLPLMDQNGKYIFGDDSGNYYSVDPASASSLPDNYYQVCMSPEDIKMVQTDAGGAPICQPNGDGTCTLLTGDYTSTMGTVPWGVNSGECVIIGGDGPVLVGGTTHIYNTTWSGIFVGLEMEKQMTFTDKLRFYFQVGMPHYKSEGTWPQRTDWQQNPSFIDEGDNGAYSYRAEIEYDYKLSDRMQLALRADTNYFHVGAVSGELYVAQYTTYMVDADGQYVLDTNGYPMLQTIAAHTEHVENSLKYANWQSFGLHMGVKYAF